jgi:hypothetical protein
MIVHVLIRNEDNFLDNKIREKRQVILTVISALEVHMGQLGLMQAHRVSNQLNSMKEKEMGGKYIDKAVMEYGNSRVRQAKLVMGESDGGNEEGKEKWYVAGEKYSEPKITENGQNAFESNEYEPGSPYVMRSPMLSPFSVDGRIVEKSWEGDGGGNRVSGSISSPMSMMNLSPGVKDILGSGVSDVSFSSSNVSFGSSVSFKSDASGSGMGMFSKWKLGRVRPNESDEQLRVWAAKTRKMHHLDCRYARGANGGIVSLERAKTMMLVVPKRCCINMMRFDTPIFLEYMEFKEKGEKEGKERKAKAREVKKKKMKEREESEEKVKEGKSGREEGDFPLFGTKPSASRTGKHDE